MPLSLSFTSIILNCYFPFPFTLLPSNLSLSTFPCFHPQQPESIFILSLSIPLLLLISSPLYPLSCTSPFHSLLCPSYLSFTPFPSHLSPYPFTPHIPLLLSSRLSLHISTPYPSPFPFALTPILLPSLCLISRSFISSSLPSLLLPQHLSPPTSPPSFIASHLSLP